MWQTTSQEERGGRENTLQTSSSSSASTLMGNEGTAEGNTEGPSLFATSSQYDAHDQRGQDYRARMFAVSSEQHAAMARESALLAPLPLLLPKEADEVCKTDLLR